MFGSIPLNPETLIGAAAAAVSLLGALMTYLISMRQTRVNVENLKFSNDTAVIGWANRAVAMMAEAQELARAHSQLEPTFLAGRQIGIAHGLSALVDEGRWYFPNSGKKDGDDAVPSAYRGHRQRILDHIVATYDAVHGLTGPDIAERIATERRSFVSKVQQAVDPSRRQWIMERFGKY